MNKRKKTVIVSVVSFSAAMLILLVVNIFSDQLVQNLPLEQGKEIEISLFLKVPLMVFGGIAGISINIALWWSVILIIGEKDWRWLFFIFLFFPAGLYYLYKYRTPEECY